MKASGVDVLISAAFAGITSIVNGKAWTNALRAYRLIMVMLLHNFYSNGAKTYEELNVYLETARGHPTGRLWVDCFVKPTLLSLMFLRGESGMVTSSSSSTVQGNAAILLRSRSPQLCPLPELVCATDGAPSPACQGGPTDRCACLSALGWGTAVPADQFREQTYIKRGKGSGDMKGISTSPEQDAVWVNSFRVCAHLDIAIEHMYNEAGEEQKPHGEVDGEEKNKHKEEGEGRRRLDEADRKKIAVELEK